MSEHQPTPEFQSEQDPAVQIISDLMDMLVDHPDYHGSAAVDNGFVYLSEAEKRGQLPSTAEDRQ